MEESILLGAPLKMEGQNQPTRVGEIVNTFADIANIVNPCEGMTVFVRDEQASYRVLSLKAKTISGVSVVNAQVDKVEKCVDNKRITGTSPDSNALTDSFKFIGSFIKDNVQDLWNYLDDMCGTDDKAGKEGIFRARFGNDVIEVYSTPLLYKENQWLQVLKGRYKVSNGSLTQSNSYNILQRTHKADTGWSEWTVVAGGDLLATMNTQIAAIEKEVTDLIGEAPPILDTIHEIAAWILNDTTGAAAMMQQINELQNAINDIEIVADENEVTLSLTDFKDEGDEVFIPAATEKRAGVMSAADKQRLATVIDDNETQDELIGALQSELSAAKENITTLSAQVTALSSGLKITTTLSPTVVYRGESSTVKVTTTLSDNIGNVEATKMNAEILGNMQEVTGTKSKVFTFNNVVLSDDNTIVKTSANYNGMTLSAKNTLYARYPIYMGVGTTYSEAAVAKNKLSARTSAKGYTYTTTTAANGQYFFLIVPTDVTQPTGFSMGGAPFAMAATTDATLNNTTYKVYKSANAYNSETTLTIKVE